jgi:hypothetical protein
MSTELSVITGNRPDISFTNYFGGKEKGEMLQISQGLGTQLDPDEPGFIQLTTLEAYQVIGHIANWLKEKTRNEAKKISSLISRQKELEKTILKDAVDCEHFIQDLKMLEIPVRLLSSIDTTTQAKGGNNA